MLCHICENKVVVQVNGWLNEKNLGSALAEGATVEVAEDKAISRLKERINGETNSEFSIKSNQEDKTKSPLKVELPVKVDVPPTVRLLPTGRVRLPLALT